MKPLMRQEDIILLHFRDVGWITRDVALKLYGIQDLPKRISVLRKEGHDIQRVLERDGGGQRYARYTFRPRDPAHRMSNCHDSTPQ